MLYVLAENYGILTSQSCTCWYSTCDLTAHGGHVCLEKKGSGLWMANWLVVWNIFSLFSHVYIYIYVCVYICMWKNHPNWLVFFKGVGIPPTRSVDGQDFNRLQVMLLMLRNLYFRRSETPRSQRGRKWRRWETECTSTMVDARWCKGM